MIWQEQVVVLDIPVEVEVTRLVEDTVQVHGVEDMFMGVPVEVQGEQEGQAVQVVTGTVVVTGQVHGIMVDTGTVTGRTCQ